MVWATVSSQSCLLLTLLYFSIFGCKEYNQSEFSIDHLLISMCRIFSCVIGGGFFLWPRRERDIKKLHSVCTCKKERPFWDVEKRTGGILPGRVVSPDIKPADSLILDFFSELWENKSILSHPVYVILLWQPQEKTFCSTLSLVFFFLFFLYFFYFYVMCNSQCLMHLCVCLCVGVCVAQSSPTLCCTWTCSPPGSSVYGTSQAKKKKKKM